MQGDNEKVSPSAPPESVRDLASEDFLFHLYRGSELLQDNRVHEAKEELEAALHLQPRDTKGQDLLALVYFRIGLYPRAIQIYEELRKHSPREPTLLINLALCYLKTGQANGARLVLEELVAFARDNKRAWGYLGLAYERLGDFEKAELAFEHAGHSQMARRVADRKQVMPISAYPAAPPETDPVESAEIRETAAAAYQELDAGELSFALAAPALRRTESGTWRAVEIGQAVKTAPSVPPPPPSLRMPAVSGAMRAPRALAESVADAKLEPIEGEVVSMHASGVLVVKPEPDVESFALRLDSLRAYTGTITSRILEKQTRTGTAQAFGGIGSPLVRVRTSGMILLGPRPGHRLVPIGLNDQIAFVREDVVVGFDLRLAYENGRLTFGEAEALAVVQLRGTGTLVIELLDPLVGLDVDSAQGKTVTIRHESVMGWSGRLVPRAVPLSEGPSGQRGLVSFSGEGTVFLSGR